VEEFQRRGVVFVDDVASVPPGAAVMLSAHGSAPEVEARAGEDGRIVVNACCPLVTKVHHEMKVRTRKGFTVLYVGHEGHEEAIGTMAVAPESARLVQDEADVVTAADEIPAGTPVALLAQTTLAHEDWSGIVDAARERFPDLWMPGRSDLCYATTNRQAAVRALSPLCDAVVVVGSSNSSNTLALAKVASASCRRVLRVNSPEQVPDDLNGVVGVTAGACTGLARAGDREAPRPSRRRRGRALHRGGRVLPSPARVARSATGGRLGPFPDAGRSFGRGVSDGRRPGGVSG